jgi:hypothetical protein
MVDWKATGNQQSHYERKKEHYIFLIHKAQTNPRHARRQILTLTADRDDLDEDGGEEKTVNMSASKKKK